MKRSVLDPPNFHATDRIVEKHSAHPVEKKDPEIVTLRRKTGDLEIRCLKLETVVRDLQKQLKRSGKRLQEAERQLEKRLNDLERQLERR